MAKNVPNRTKISELVWLYIKRRPFVYELLREGVANYSGLARRICLEMYGNIKKEQAVKAALIRLGKKLERIEEGLEEKILRLLRRSSLSIKTKVAVVISDRKLDMSYITYARSRFYTYVVDERVVEKIKRMRGIVKIEENLDLVVIESGPELEETPGVIASLLSALAMEGINVVEIISCYTDTMLVVRQADTARAYEILRGMMSEKH
ncbi:MAG: ACT domain-containing protein [Candidatus Anstonellales archaeon]